MLIAVISDTHMPSRATTLPEDCRARLARADLIIHAGDHSTADAVIALRDIGPPVLSVYGNVDTEDVRAILPEVCEVEAGGLRIGVVHDAGPADGRLARMRRRFPAADLVVFGHSHIPLVESDSSGFTILNPGSPTDRRRQPHHTMAEVEVRPDGARPPVIRILRVGVAATDGE